MTVTDAQRAYDQIKERIITTKMPPGAVISEAALQSELSLGRTPIREALKRLQSENLVHVKPRRGIFVADISLTDLTQIYEVRVELEGLCARLATRRITPSQLEQMRELVDRYQKADPTDRDLLIDLDRRFHHLLAEAAHNKFLREEMDQFYSLSLRIWHLALNYIQPEDLDVRAHEEVLAAIEDGDSERAEQRMREHIQYFHRTIKRYL